ncbi:DNA-directed RNA polymerase sigma-70 factor [Fulvitalea axinellae]|uniref:DNA-directed RNA polymerase sigma-70 factor n=1 Tax=Fulvitalea axinellae TaxID=1182444 RepID=A0AAU9CH76_9BACT|nr:DNA-directed RNA polymerase sigma-70 factor [Fulvitalea axinellae]
MLLSDEKALLHCLKKKRFENVFKLLYYESYPKLFRYAYSILGSQEQAEDIVQNVFSDLWERKEQLKIKGSLGAFLLRAVMYSAMGAKRKQKTELEHAPAISSELYSDGVFIDPSQELSELETRLSKGLEALPEQCRNVFCLSRFSGLGRKEIAETLGISVRTVDTHLYRAIKKLEIIFKD